MTSPCSSYARSHSRYRLAVVRLRFRRKIHDDRTARGVLRSFERSIACEKCMVIHESLLTQANHASRGASRAFVIRFVAALKGPSSVRAAYPHNMSKSTQGIPCWQQHLPPTRRRRIASVPSADYGVMEDQWPQRN